MRCEDIAVELDAYSTGELDAGRCTLIEQHIQQCPACGAELARIRKENALYRDYASAAADSARAEARLPFPEAKPGSNRVPWMNHRIPFSIPRWIPAAAAMVILVSGLSWYYFARQSAPDIAENVIPGQPNEAAVPIAQALKDLEQAIASLQNSYAERKPQLDPKLVKELDRNLEVTRTAIRECRQALKNNPDDNQAAEFLMLDYQKQIDILKHISEGL